MLVRGGSHRVSKQIPYASVKGSSGVCVARRPPRLTKTRCLPLYPGIGVPDCYDRETTFDEAQDLYQ